MLADDRSKGAEVDATVMISFLSGRVVAQCLGTGEAKRRQIWGKSIKSFVGGCEKIKSLVSFHLFRV